MSGDGPLYQKFDIRRADGTDAPGEKHDGCQYFVLDLTHDPYARRAALEYGRLCMDTHPTLGVELVNLATDLIEAEEES